MRIMRLLSHVWRFSCTHDRSAVCIDSVASRDVPLAFCAAFTSSLSILARMHALGGARLYVGLPCRPPTPRRLLEECLTRGVLSCLGGLVVLLLVVGGGVCCFQPASMSLGVGARRDDDVGVIAVAARRRNALGGRGVVRLPPGEVHRRQRAGVVYSTSSTATTTSCWKTIHDGLLQEEHAIPLPAPTPSHRAAAAAPRPRSAVVARPPRPTRPPFPRRQRHSRTWRTVGALCRPLWAGEGLHRRRSGARPPAGAATPLLARNTPPFQ